MLYLNTMNRGITMGSCRCLHVRLKYFFALVDRHKKSKSRNRNSEDNLMDVRLCVTLNLV